MKNNNMEPRPDHHHFTCFSFISHFHFLICSML